MAKKNNRYEGMFLLKSKAAKEGWDGLVESVGKIVEAAGGTVANAVKWEERKLTYNIKGHSRAAYMLVHFEAPPTGIDSIQRSCNLSDLVLRVLILKDDGDDHKEEAVEVPRKEEAVEVPRKEESDGESK